MTQYEAIQKLNYGIRKLRCCLDNWNMECGHITFIIDCLNQCINQMNAINVRKEFELKSDKEWNINLFEKYRYIFIYYSEDTDYEDGSMSGRYDIAIVERKVWKHIEYEYSKGYVFNDGVKDGQVITGYVDNGRIDVTDYFQYLNNCPRRNIAWKNSHLYY